MAPGKGLPEGHAALVGAGGQREGRSSPARAPVGNDSNIRSVVFCVDFPERGSGLLAPELSFSHVAAHRTEGLSQPVQLIDGLKQDWRQRASF